MIGLRGQDMPMSNANLFVAPHAAINAGPWRGDAWRVILVKSCIHHMCQKGRFLIRGHDESPSCKRLHRFNWSDSIGFVKSTIPNLYAFRLVCL